MAHAGHSKAVKPLAKPETPSRTGGRFQGPSWAFCGFPQGCSGRRQGRAVPMGSGPGLLYTTRGGFKGQRLGLARRSLQACPVARSAPCRSALANGSRLTHGGLAPFSRQVRPQAVPLYEALGFSSRDDFAEPGLLWQSRAGGEGGVQGLVGRTSGNKRRSTSRFPDSAAAGPGGSAAACIPVGNW